MPAQEKLSPIEQYVAYIAGLGVAVMILALLLIGLGTANHKLTTSLLIVGLMVFLLGVGGWLYFLRPWKQFDDLKTPHYTGHHAEAEKPAEAAPAAAAPAETAQAIAVPAAPVVAAAPAAPVRAEAPVAAAKVPEAAPVKAAAPAAAAPTADDLTVIEGIGPKSAAALATGGITTFAQVAQMTPDALEAVVKGQKVRLVGSTATWPAQARLAAAGDLTALEDYQKRIKSGGKPHDDLTQIEGVGPKAQQALYKAGIITYQDLAQTLPDTLHKILNDAGLKNLNPERWSEQAALIVKEDLTGLKKLQDEL